MDLGNFFVDLNKKKKKKRENSIDLVQLIANDLGNKQIDFV